TFSILSHHPQVFDKPKGRINRVGVASAHSLFRPVTTQASSAILRCGFLHFYYAAYSYFIIDGV
ncbi:hypothetical protein, partial [Alicyclobacillus suci]|uniref:hypothetical protein n=1 Tax=Alicyclobacillus suci TaxID=2816080 RepID=UPI001A8DDBFA